MRRYETVFIVTPDSSEEELQAVADKFRGVITGMNGKVAAYDEQGKKSLAYNIKKQSKGYYVLMDYLGHADVVAELERNMRLDDRILNKPKKEADKTEVAEEEAQSPEAQESEEEETEED